jgi:hypothetical protein
MSVPDALLRPSAQRVLWSGGFLALLFLFSILVTTVPDGNDALLIPSEEELAATNDGDNAWMLTSTALVLLMVSEGVSWGAYF